MGKMSFIIRVILSMIRLCDVNIRSEKPKTRLVQWQEKPRDRTFAREQPEERKVIFFYLFRKGGGGLGNIQRSVCKLMVSGCGWEWRRVVTTVAERDGNSISHPSRRKPLHTHTHVREHARTYTRPWASKEDLPTHTLTHTHVRARAYVYTVHISTNVHTLAHAYTHT